MFIIAHRGLLLGPDIGKENDPHVISNAIAQGFDVEVDVWYVKEQWYLGHDKPTHPVTFKWLRKRAKKLWVHCKNFEAASNMGGRRNVFNSFFHRVDRGVLTTKGYLWTFTGEIPLTIRSIVVLPENYLTSLEECAKLPKIAGICTDYPIEVRHILQS